MRPLKLLLLSPRGFCAGVQRAIQIVEETIARFGAPVYVRHEVVHNPFVIADLAEKGAIFVDELDAAPDGVPVVFSAHGVPKSVREEAERRGIMYIDATCPLVTKVHREVTRHTLAGRQTILIGHMDHPEVLGTMGQGPPGAVILVQSTSDALAVPIDNTKSYGLATQTTLSVKDAAEITEVLRGRVPRLLEPSRSDICYATTNRQAAVAAVAGRCDAIVIIGGPNSSNSHRLAEVARYSGCRRVTLIGCAADLDVSFFEGVKTFGVSSGASTPETLVQELVDNLASQFELCVEEVVVSKEATRFGMPRFAA